MEIKSPLKVSCIVNKWEWVIVAGWLPMKNGMFRDLQATAVHDMTIKPSIKPRSRWQSAGAREARMVVLLMALAFGCTHKYQPDHVTCPMEV